MAKLQDSWVKTMKAISELLDDDQLLSWNEMTGKESKFPENVRLGLLGGGPGGPGYNWPLVPSRLRELFCLKL